MIDVLYIYRESPNNGLELKYSLRSLEKYVRDVDRVFIATDRMPEFLKEVNQVEVKDLWCPMATHWWKIKNVIDKTDISPNFALMYDDIFFVKETNLTNYPHYQKGRLIDNKDGGEHYRQTLLNARDWLKKDRWGEPYNFEVHTPFVYCKDAFKYLTDIFMPLMNDCQAMAVRSVYGNLFCKESPYRGDIKIRDNTKVEDVIGVGDCFSCSDDAFNCQVKGFLEKEFPEKSRCER